MYHFASRKSDAILMGIYSKMKDYEDNEVWGRGLKRLHSDRKSFLEHFWRVGRVKFLQVAPYTKALLVSLLA